MEHVAPPPGEPSPEEDRLQHRKRSLLVLVLRYLHDEGYGQSYRTLCAESGMSLAQFDVADNIDLNTVVQGYEDFCESKYGRRPKLMRRLSGVFRTPIMPLSSPGSTPATCPSGHGFLVSPAHSPIPAAMLLQGTAGDQHSGKTTTTFRAGTNEPVTQEELVRRLADMMEPDPNQHFQFERPKRNTSKKRSTLLNLSEVQEDVLYALVGCANVGWSIRSISTVSKDFLARRCGISKDVLQLFFKNRAQRPKRQRSNKRPSPPTPPQPQTPTQNNPQTQTQPHPTHLSQQQFHNPAPAIATGQHSPAGRNTAQPQPLHQLQPPFQHRLPGQDALANQSFQSLSQPFQTQMHPLHGHLGRGSIVQPHSQSHLPHIPVQQQMQQQMRSMLEQRQSLLMMQAPSAARMHPLDVSMPISSLQHSPAPIPHMVISQQIPVSPSNIAPVDAIHHPGVNDVMPVETSATRLSDQDHQTSEVSLKQSQPSHRGIEVANKATDGSQPLSVSYGAATDEQLAVGHQGVNSVRNGAVIQEAPGEKLKLSGSEGGIVESAKCGIDHPVQGNVKITSPKDNGAQLDASGLHRQEELCPSANVRGVEPGGHENVVHHGCITQLTENSLQNGIDGDRAQKHSVVELEHPSPGPTTHCQEPYVSHQAIVSGLLSQNAGSDRHVADSVKGQVEMGEIGNRKIEGEA